eukprot:GILK01006687.1.p1 GENE.GILK01006687.1~~GILK01006687.1.p1  ORF type:complete len:888 (+),score=130.49 GILK01006687.1:52-2715(+)
MFSYKFSNLCGTVYRSGNLIFTPDGNSLLSPVGNRVSVFDLINNACYTLPFENRKDVSRIHLSPDGRLLLSVDEEGFALLINFPKRIVLHHFNFKAPVNDVKFSPDGRYIAVTHNRKIQVWQAPGLSCDVSPFVLHRTYTGSYDDVVSLTWSDDSRFFLAGSKDNNARLYSIHPIPGFVPVTLSGHKTKLINCFFANNMRTIYTISHDGTVIVWRWSPMEDSTSVKQEITRGKGEGEGDSASDAVLAAGKWTLESKHYFKQQGAKVVCAELHHDRQLLVVGFSTGVFGLYETLPTFNNIHTLSISQKKIDTLCVNSTGEWLAFGSAKLGQLLVWEWQSETQILKQQGHFFDLNVVAYSPDGHNIATGGDDGKVKLWNTTSAFCFVTFTEHTGPITAASFTPQGNAVVTASLDGSVRAFDLVRYRNFRVMTSPTPVQFTSLALDPSGEIVCAGTLEPFDIFVWSLQTGKLLDILSGHEGPISSLSFSPSQPLLASGSWDKTVRVWDMFARKAKTETFQHTSDVLTVAFRPDGKELCAATLSGQLSFWNVADGILVASIEGRRDIIGGRKIEDRMTSKNSNSNKHFNSVCYSADGLCVLAGGNSKYVCIYEVPHKILLRKFQLSNNRSLDGVLDMLNSKDMTEAGPTQMIDDLEASDLDDRMDDSLPGAKRGDLSSRRVRKAIRTKCVRFSPNGRAWCAASTEGLLIYSLDESLTFDPMELDIEITRENILKMSYQGEHARALVMSLRLNESPLIRAVYEHIPPAQVPLVAQSVPLPFLQRLLSFLASQVEVSVHLDLNMLWCLSLFNHHGRYLKDNSSKCITTFRALQKALTKQHTDLAKLCDENQYSLEYLCSVGQKQQQQAAEAEVTDELVDIEQDALFTTRTSLF